MNLSKGRNEENMILDKIVESTKVRVKNIYETQDVEEIKSKAFEMAKNDSHMFDFEQKLMTKPIAFICEVKKASPSKGLIAEDFDYIQIAKDYEKAGASAISVLTEPDYFMGSSRYLNEISENVNIPLLRKDFVIDEIQIYEAKVIGASAVLLICAILDDSTLMRYIKLADSLGLSALVEAHDEEEIKMAVHCGARIIGVNNRNLKDFTVDIDNSVKLRKLVDKEILFVSESGIKTSKDIKRLVDNNVNAVLIGETLMRSNDKGKMLNDLKSEVLA